MWEPLLGLGQRRWVHSTGWWEGGLGGGLETRADIGAGVLGDQENRLILGFVSIPYWALKINYQVPT